MADETPDRQPRESTVVRETADVAACARDYAAGGPARAALTKAAKAKAKKR